MKSVIFDFNGTLLFDSKIHDLAWQLVAKDKLGLNLSLDDIKFYFHGVPNVMAIEKAKPNYYSENEKIEISKYKEQVYRNLLTESKMNLVKGSFEFFEYLKDSNIKFTIASASIFTNILFFYKHYKLSNYFDFLHIIYDNGKYVNKVNMFLDSCRVLDTDIEHSIVFEDSISGVESAINAGCKNIILIHHNQDIRDFDKYKEIIFKADNYYDVLSFFKTSIL